MKNIFDIDMDQDNEVKTDGDGLVTERVPADLAAQIERYQDTVIASVKLFVGPIWMRVIQYVALFLGLLFVGVGVKIAFEGLVLWLFLVGGALLAVALALFIRTAVLEKKAENSEEEQAMDRRRDQLEAAVRAALNVSPEAKDVEVLFHGYEIKGEPDSPKRKEQEWDNGMKTLDADGENLYLSDWDDRYTIPRSTLSRIEYEKKKLALPFWIKGGEPKAYGLKQKDDGSVTLPGHYRVVFNWNGEEWFFAVPPYEIEYVAEIAGLPIPETAQ